MKIVRYYRLNMQLAEEEFLNLPVLHKDDADIIVAVINRSYPPNSLFRWKVVENDYILHKGLRNIK